MESEELKPKFLKIYANLPLSLRKEPILVLDNEPLTWSAVYVEVVNNTERAYRILKKLKGLEII